MNAVKRQKPTISPDDIERLLFHLEDARRFIVKYGSAQSFTSTTRAVADHATSAIDALAGQITGDPKFLCGEHVTAGGNEQAYQAGKYREARRRRLLGVHIPLSLVKLNPARLGAVEAGFSPNPTAND